MNEMNEEELDIHQNNALAKEDMRQKSEIIARCYNDIKNGVVMIQDAIESGEKILNKHLLNLLEEPLEKLIKLAEFIDAREYYDNFVRQKNYLTSSTYKLDATLKERLENIVESFDFLINQLQTRLEEERREIKIETEKLEKQIKKTELQIELLNHIFNSDEKSFDINYYVDNGVDLNELIDCDKIMLPKYSEYTTEVSIFGACLIARYDSDFIEKLIEKGADVNRICEIRHNNNSQPSGLSFIRNFYPLQYLVDLNDSSLYDSEMLEVFNDSGIDLNGYVFETVYDDPKYYNHKDTLLSYFVEYSDGNCTTAKSICDFIYELESFYDFNRYSDNNYNLIYHNDGRKHTITDSVLRVYSTSRELQKLFVGTKYDIDFIMNNVLDLSNFNNLDDYLKIKNCILFLAEDINILTDFSYNLKDGNEFTGSLLGILAYRINKQKSDTNIDLSDIITDFYDLLKNLNIKLEYIALKDNKGNEYSFKDISSSSYAQSPDKRLFVYQNQVIEKFSVFLCPFCDSDKIRKGVNSEKLVDEYGDEWNYKCADCGEFFNTPCEQVGD